MVVVQSNDLKKKLLATARDLLMSDGYRNFSLRKVARQTGVSATSVYNYFENKDDLIHVLMEQSIDRLNAQIEQVMERQLDPLSRLKAFAFAYVNFALEHPREYQIIFLISSDEMSRYPKEKFRKARRGYIFVTQTIQEAVNQGIFNESHPRIAAYSLWAQLHGVMDVVLSKRLDSKIDQQKFIDKAISNILQGFGVNISQPQGKHI